MGWLVVDHGLLDERGSSLVEVLVALFLISVALLAATPMFVLSMKQNALGSDMGRVGARATARLELLRTTPYFELGPGGGLASNVTGYFDASDPDVVVRWQIVDGGGPAGTKTLAVRAIASRQMVGRASSIELRTLRVR
jgi:hypothetical protein